MMKSVSKLKTIYIAAKLTKVGCEAICPSCGTVFVKKNYQQAFCKSKSGTTCKDYYWNNVTPSKRNNTTRISPASAKWMASQKMDYYNYDVHTFSCEGLGQWDDC